MQELLSTFHIFRVKDLVEQSKMVDDLNNESISPLLCGLQSLASKTDLVSQFLQALRPESDMSYVIEMEKKIDKKCIYEIGEFSSHLITHLNETFPEYVLVNSEYSDVFFLKELIRNNLCFQIFQHDLTDEILRSFTSDEIVITLSKTLWVDICLKNDDSVRKAIFIFQKCNVVDFKPKHINFSAIQCTKEREKEFFDVLLPFTGGIEMV